MTKEEILKSYYFGRRFPRKCPNCKSSYFRETDLIGATGRQCRICDFAWDNAEDLDKEEILGGSEQ